VGPFSSVLLKSFWGESWKGVAGRGRTRRTRANDRYPLDAPDHPSLPNFVQYLNDYVDHFKIRDQINLTTKVTKLDLNPDKNSAYKHIATILHIPSNKTYTLKAQKVIITTGLHVLPNIPPIKGLTVNEDERTPEWIHSSSYKSREQLAGKKVLVLGCGETGMDVGYESVLAPAERVWMGVRSGFLSFPKVLNNFRVLGATFDGALPIDGLITNLFETA
jgi:dimethylaniline monooxygenase (N-oxide forming)